MHPEQIKKAAVDLLHQINQSPHPANEVISAYTRSRRYIGSKDRKALTDMVWKVLRYQAHLSWRTKEIDAQIALLETAHQDMPGMPDWVKWECPQWLITHIPQADKELPALITPAPIVLRANGDRNAIRTRLAAEGIETTLTDKSPYGLIMAKRCHLNVSETFKQGLIEVQDEGSQLIALETEIQPEEHVLDMCAGAGGKSLILSQMMHNTGRIVAHDISFLSLKELGRRANRAQATNIEIATKLPDEKFDTVVVDAPCSGTGTWRRCPDAKWKLTPEQFQNIQKTQAMLLNQAAERTKNKLCYMTCSLTQDENETQTAAFLQRHPDFHLIKEKRFSPYRTQTDGFYVAVLQKT